jgi:signal transduction histidine kinase
LRLEQSGIRAFALAPICEHGRLVAILVAAGAEPYPWSDHETRLIQDVATRTRAAVDRARAVKAMREREAELRDANETLERRVAEALAERRLMAELIQMTDTFVQVLDREFRVLAINPANAAEYEKVYGFRPKIGDSIAEHLADRPELREQALAIWSRALGGEAFTVTQEFGDPTHRRRTYEMTLRPLCDTEGRVIGAYQFSTDVTERRLADLRLAEAQEQLRQSQKMEAVGQLTGGIAHDFNNLLAGIIGSLELLERRIGDGRLAGIERYIESARTASQRAAALTQRLLAFSRRQTLAPRPVDLNRVVVDMVELIRRSVGPAVEVRVAGEAALWMIRVDVSQIESALLNLCLNARDAMTPRGGRLTIETENAALDERAARAWDLPPGHYVRLSVRDTGAGMSPDIIARAFDPFFTTKPLGRGTGLGLSMVHGFVQQSKGQVKIQSEPGRGTTITIHLPRFLGLAERDAAGREEQGRNGAGQTILVVDDEPSVRLFMVDTLRDSGYRVVDAADGSGALQILQSKAQIDLLVSDVGLPGNLNGRQVADAARASRAGLKILFVTGYAETLALREGDLDWGMEVITKPFATSAFVAKVRDLLSEGAARR